MGFIVTPKSITPSTLRTFISLYDPTGGLPAVTAIGDTYIALATAHGWTINRIYEWNGSSWVETIPTDGYTMISSVSHIEYYYCSSCSMWLTLSSLTFDANVFVDFYDPTGGLPVVTANGTRYVALATANGWTLNRIYTYNGLTWSETTPTDGYELLNKTSNILYYYCSSCSMWLTLSSLTFDANVFIDFYDPTPSLPGSPAIGDTYVALATANGWTLNRIYRYNGLTWSETTPTDGYELLNKTSNILYYYCSSYSLWSVLKTKAVDSNVFIDFYDPTPSLPGSPAIGDTYVALATANGWTLNRIYRYNGLTWSETTPTGDYNLKNKTNNKIYIYVSATATWTVVSPVASMSTTKLQVNATPYACNNSSASLFLAVDYTATGACAISINADMLTTANTIVIKDTGGLAGTRNITITGTGAETFDGAASCKIDSNYGSITLISYNGNWTIN